MYEADFKLRRLFECVQCPAKWMLLSGGQMAARGKEQRPHLLVILVVLVLVHSTSLAVGKKKDSEMFKFVVSVLS